MSLYSYSTANSKVNLQVIERWVQKADSLLKKSEPFFGFNSYPHKKSVPSSDGTLHH